MRSLHRTAEIVRNSDEKREIVLFCLYWRRLRGHSFCLIARQISNNWRLQWRKGQIGGVHRRRLRHAAMAKDKAVFRLLRRIVRTSGRGNKRCLDLFHSSQLFEHKYLNWDSILILLVSLYRRREFRNIFDSISALWQMRINL